MAKLLIMKWMPPERISEDKIVHFAIKNPPDLFVSDDEFLFIFMLFVCFMFISISI